MCKIDKEKLLKEFRGVGSMYLSDVRRVIKNFPEEQEIDFDALYDEWGEKPMNWSESISPYDQARSFYDFLKSKNLTAPKPVEIPVKKTWTLKKEYHEYHLKMCIGTMVDVKVDEEPKHPEYYDLHEEPDYSKIPKGSIVEFDYIYCGKKNSNAVYHFDCCDSKNVAFRVNGYTLTVDRCNIKNIRIVELAKENV